MGVSPQSSYRAKTTKSKDPKHIHWTHISLKSLISLVRNTCTKKKYIYIYIEREREREMDKEKETNDEREIWKLGWVATIGTSGRMRERKSDKFKIKNRATCVWGEGGKKNKKLMMREKREMVGGGRTKKNKKLTMREKRKLTMREKREMGKEEETNDERVIWEVG